MVRIQKSIIHLKAANLQLLNFINTFPINDKRGQREGTVFISVQMNVITSVQLRSCSDAFSLCLRLTEVVLLTEPFRECRALMR